MRPILYLGWWTFYFELVFIDDQVDENDYKVKEGEKLVE